MFTGLIEEVGAVVSVVATAHGAQLQITARAIASRLRVGDSVAVNGCCLTVAAMRGDELTFDLLQETLDRTNLRTLAASSRVNLERALPANGRLGGHFVQGHIDSTAKILALEQRGADHRVEIELPRAFSRYVAAKGSIAISGISLTVAEIGDDRLVVWIIPHTMLQTNLGTARAGDIVNLEFDILAKYVERMLASRRAE